MSLLIIVLLCHQDLIGYVSLCVSSHHLECQEVSSWRWVHVGTKGWPAVQEHSRGCSPQFAPGWEGLRYIHLLCRPCHEHTNQVINVWMNVKIQIKEDERVRDSQRVWWCNTFQGLGCGVCGLQKALCCYRLTQAPHRHVTGRWSRTPKRHWPARDVTTWRGSEQSECIHHNTALKFSFKDSRITFNIPFSKIFL